MDEREFVQVRQAGWDRLAAILQQVSSAGLSGLPRESVRELGGLYRRAAADLAYARAHAVSPSLIGHLNHLVAHSYALLYQSDGKSWRGIGQFLSQDLPKTFRRRLTFFLVAVAITAVGFGIAYGLVVHSRGNIDLFVPPNSPLRSSVDQWESGHVTQKADPAMISMAGFYVTHNSEVAFLAFALGALGGIVTAVLMFENGAMLGALTGLMTVVHQHHNYWPALLPHGVVEMTAIFIAGGAGLSLGWAILCPGRFRRRDAFALAGRDAVKLVMGVVLMLVFAGITEAFVSHSILPAPLKVAYGILSGVALYTYLGLSGRATSDR